MFCESLAPVLVFGSGGFAVDVSNRFLGPPLYLPGLVPLPDPAGPDVPPQPVDPATLVEITLDGERRRIAAYDLHIEFRHAGESTYAEGPVVFGGERHHIVVASSTSDRGTTYILDGETHWWSEIRWLDEWFEDLWMDAAAKADKIDFDALMKSEERSGE